MRPRTRARLLPLAVALALVVAAGCGSDEPSSSGNAAPQGFTPPEVPMLQSLGAGEGKVNLVAWAGYVEDGSTDPKVDWVTPFEKDTGCKVNVKVAGTSDEMVQLMKSGQYDAVSASGDASLRLIYAGDVAPVNTDLVTNYDDVFDGPEDQPWNSVNGVAYGIPARPGREPADVPHRPGQAGPDSWGAVFDPDSPHKGKVTAYDSPIYIADAALYLMSTKPELGITNAYALDDTQFQAAMDLLKQQSRASASTGATTPRRSRRSSAAIQRPRHDLAGHREPGQGRQGPGRGDPAQGGRDRLVRHLDGLRQGEATPTARTCGWTTSSRRRPTPQRGRVVRRGPVEQAVLHEDGRPEPLRHLPRRGRGLLRPGLVLEHADRACLRRTHRRAGLQGLRRVDPAWTRSRAERWRAARQGALRPACRGPRRGAGHRAEARRCCSRRRWAGWSSPTWGRWRCCSSPSLWTVNSFTGDDRPPADHRQLPDHPAPSRSTAPSPLRTVALAAAVTVIDAALALPVAFFMAKVARRRWRPQLLASPC